VGIYDEIRSGGNFFVIAGPCAVESESLCLEIAGEMQAICDELGIQYIFKSSYRKANRTRLDAFTGIGDDKALNILRKVREEFNLPVITDVHETAEIASVARSVDMLQIPAFLCRQTDLLLEAGRSGLPVNIKKGQFLSGASMQFAAEKVASTGNDQILLTERGNSFGYGDLVVDFRNIPDMKRTGYPVVLDATHSVQRPNTAEGVSGGQPEYIETLALAGTAAGVDGLFIECHPEPLRALSDGSNMMPLSGMKALLDKIMTVRRACL
jgi:2-dehydro-3-deoxyphosphooctonate aldolase (KDO 8-P synthase)